MRGGFNIPVGTLMVPKSKVNSDWMMSPNRSAQRKTVPADEILLDQTAFWVVTRGRIFGPFDYQWSPDLRGMELTYQGQKFGEICSEEELFADLTEFQLPMSVCRVAVITAGTLAAGIVDGHCMEERISQLLTSLDSFGYGRFLVRQSETS